MKFHGIHQSQSGSTTTSEIRDTLIASPRRKTSSPAGSSNKKRKLDSYVGTTSNMNTDDDEGVGSIKAESSTPVKAEIKAEIKTESVKEEEPTGQEVVPDSMNVRDSTASMGVSQHIADGAMGFNGVHDSAMFDDFLAYGGSIRFDDGSLASLNDGHSGGKVASIRVAPTTRSGDGQGVHETILITD